MHWFVLLLLATVVVAPATAQELKSEDDKALSGSVQCPV